jgi:hypothetical protein
MFQVYAAGYYAARWGISRWCNPWHVALAEQRRRCR